jgi:opacity protein-like surface antigen
VLSDDAWGIADAKNSEYYEANWTVPVAESWTAVAHVGRSEFEGASNDALNYTDYKASLEYAWNDNLTVGAGYSWTNASKSSWTIQNEYQGESQALGWVTWTF